MGPQRKNSLSGSNKPRVRSGSRSAYGGITIDDLDLVPSKIESQSSQASKSTTKDDKENVEVVKERKRGGSAVSPQQMTLPNSGDRRDFPSERAAKVGVLDPSERWRFYWDVTCMVFMLYVLYVTPYELAFVHHLTTFDPLQVLNFLVDFGFLMEIFITMNTAYFDHSINCWIIDRRLIFKRYAGSWMWIDVASLPRWDLLLASFGFGSQFKFFRLLRLFRLIRLVRILRAPEIMERLMNRFSLSFKSSLVVKYFLVLISILHVEACAIRLAHDIVRRERKNTDIATYLTESRWRIFRSKITNSNFSVYIDCLDWAFQTLLGQSVYVNSAEGIMSITNNFIGMMYISFLIGELANVMCNLDPASNEYKKTVDMLNIYMSEHSFPEQMKWQLRVYLANSEELFRSRFHDQLISQLSPPLQELVAHFMLGARVLQAPFFSYARQATLGLVVGRKIWVKQSSSSMHGTHGGNNGYFNKNKRDDEVSDADNTVYVREAKIIMLHGGLRFDVRYIDDDSIEHEVTNDRLSMEHESGEMQRAVDNMNHVTKLIVTQFAKVMKMSLFNAGDYVIRKNVSRTKHMYLVDRGNAVAFGRDITRPFSITYYREGGCFGDSELATLAAGHRPRLHWYNARVTVVTRMLVLNADDFLDIISTPGYEEFYRYVQRYGIWANFKVNFYLALKDGSLFSRILGTWKDPDQVDGVSKVNQAKMYEAMMVGAASTHYERLLASKLAMQTVHTEELLIVQSKHQEKLDMLRREQMDELRNQLHHVTERLDRLINAVTQGDNGTIASIRDERSTPSSAKQDFRHNNSQHDGDGEDDTTHSIEYIENEPEYNGYTRILPTSHTPTHRPAASPFSSTRDSNRQGMPRRAFNADDREHSPVHSSLLQSSTSSRRSRSGLFPPR